MLFFQVCLGFCHRSLRRRFPREIQGRLFRDAEEENSPGSSSSQNSFPWPGGQAWLWEKLPALKFFPGFCAGPGKIQSIQVERGGGKNGIYGARGRHLGGFSMDIPSPTSLSPGFLPLFSSSFSPQVDSGGFCWTDQVLCALGEGRAAHESKRSFYNQSNQSGQLRADPGLEEEEEEGGEGGRLLAARCQGKVGRKGNLGEIPLKSPQNPNKIHGNQHGTEGGSSNILGFWNIWILGTISEFSTKSEDSKPKFRAGSGKKRNIGKIPLKSQ